MKAIVCTKLGEPNLLEIKEIDKPSITCRTPSVKKTVL